MNIKRNGMILLYVNDEFKNNKKIIEEAVSNCGNALMYAPFHFRCDYFSI